MIDLQRKILIELNDKFNEPDKLIILHTDASIFSTIDYNF